MKTGKAVAIGVLSGIAAGALLGVLFAPNKGSVTRKKISRKSSDALDDFKGKLDDVLSSFNEKLDDVKEEITETYKTGKAKIDYLKKEARTQLS